MSNWDRFIESKGGLQPPPPALPPANPIGPAQPQPPPTKNARDLLAHYLHTHAASPADVVTSRLAKLAALALPFVKQAQGYYGGGGYGGYGSYGGMGGMGGMPGMGFGGGFNQGFSPYGARGRQLFRTDTSNWGGVGFGSPQAPTGRPGQGAPWSLPAGYNWGHRGVFGQGGPGGPGGFGMGGGYGGGGGGDYGGGGGYGGQPQPGAFLGGMGGQDVWQGGMGQPQGGSLPQIPGMQELQGQRDLLSRQFASMRNLSPQQMQRYQTLMGRFDQQEQALRKAHGGQQGGQPGAVTQPGGGGYQQPQGQQGGGPGWRPGDFGQAESVGGEFSPDPGATGGGDFGDQAGAGGAGAGAGAGAGTAKGPGAGGAPGAEAQPGGGGDFGDQGGGGAVPASQGGGGGGGGTVPAATPGAGGVVPAATPREPTAVDRAQQESQQRGTAAGQAAPVGSTPGVVPAGPIQPTTVPAGLNQEEGAQPERPQTPEQVEADIAAGRASWEQAYATMKQQDPEAYRRAVAQRDERAAPQWAARRQAAAERATEAGQVHAPSAEPYVAPQGETGTEEGSAAPYGSQQAQANTQARQETMRDPSGEPTATSAQSYEQQHPELAQQAQAGQAKPAQPPGTGSQGSIMPGVGAAAGPGAASQAAQAAPGSPGAAKPAQLR